MIKMVIYIQYACSCKLWIKEEGGCDSGYFIEFLVLLCCSSLLLLACLLLARLSLVACLLVVPPPIHNGRSTSTLKDVWPNPTRSIMDDLTFFGLHYYLFML